MDKTDVFSHVDHTQLKAAATWQDIEKLCEEAREHGMASVCIPPSYVSRAHKQYPDVTVCTVIGFPLGYHTGEAKLAEARQALLEGAAEIDVVVNLGDVKDGRFDLVTEEIRALKELAGERILKVIVETCYLTGEEKIALCGCVTRAGADFIKTSTGFGSAGAQMEDIELFKQYIGPGVKIKASGGIRTAEAMEAFLKAGVERIGASAAVTAYAGQDTSKAGY